MIIPARLCPPTQRIGTRQLVYPLTITPFWTRLYPPTRLQCLPPAWLFHTRQQGYNASPPAWLFHTHQQSYKASRQHGHNLPARESTQGMYPPGISTQEIYHPGNQPARQPTRQGIHPWNHPRHGIHPGDLPPRESTCQETYPPRNPARESIRQHGSMPVQTTKPPASMAITYPP